MAKTTKKRAPRPDMWLTLDDLCLAEESVDLRLGEIERRAKTGGTYSAVRRRELRALATKISRLVGLILPHHTPRFEDEPTPDFGQERAMVVDYATVNKIGRALRPPARPAAPHRAAGGHARAKALPAHRRSEIARNAANTRWSGRA